MTTILYAQPYQIGVEGFCFSDFDDYETKQATIKDSFGQPVEEFEIQFIDGGQLSQEVFEAWPVTQANLTSYFDALEDWDEEQKIRFIVAVQSGCYGADEAANDPDSFDLDLYRVDSLRDLAMEFVEEGLFGEIPENIRFYLDYDAIARDLDIDGYTEIIVAGERLIYRCG